MKTFLRRLALSSAIALPLAAQAAHPFAGFYYSSNGTTVAQYTTEGSFVRTIAQADSSGEPRGVAKGPGGMYLVRSNAFTPSVVQVVDGHGAVTRTYSFDGWTGGMVTSGNVRFSPAKDYFYVAAQNGVYRFPVNGSEGILFISRMNWADVCDVAVMPNGDLLVVEDYAFAHYTAEGTLRRTFDRIKDPLHLAPPNASLSDVRGVAYDAATDTTFVTMLGYTDFYFQLLAFEGTSNVLKGRTSFVYGAGLDVTPQGTLLVGSWTQNPGIFSFTHTTPMTFAQIGSLPASDATFVTSTRPAKLDQTK